MTKYGLTELELKVKDLEVAILGLIEGVTTLQTCELRRIDSGEATVADLLPEYDIEPINVPAPPDWNEGYCQKGINHL